VLKWLFSYVGYGSFSELVVELDFEFKAGIFEQMGHRYPIETNIEFFEMWQQNFSHYASKGIYSIEITFCSSTMDPGQSYCSSQYGQTS